MQRKLTAQEAQEGHHNVQDDSQVILEHNNGSTALPEAPASVNVRVQIAGREVQWTLRDVLEERLATRLEALLARYPVPQPPSQPTGQLSPQQHNAAAMGKQATGVCPIHSVQMRWNDGKDGKRGWYSHKTSEGWCKGR